MTSFVPNVKEAQQKLKIFSKSPDEWRQFILQTIDYALQNSNTANPNVSKEVATVILESLYELKQQNSNENDYLAAESVIVDALWLKGALLEEFMSMNEANTTTTAAAATAATTDSSKSQLEMSKVKDQYQALCQLIQYLSGINTLPTDSKTSSWVPIPIRKFQSSLEPSLLAASGLLPNKSVDFFIKRMKKVNTEMFYRQKKVNLLQEESEGYAKFLRFLTNLPMVNDDNTIIGSALKSKRSSDNLEYHSKEIHLRVSEFIGTFDLDPNRCLDLALDVLESQIQQATMGRTKVESLYDAIRDAPSQYRAVKQLLVIIRLFPVENITHLIGFKLANVKDDTTTTDESFNTLHVTTALLTHHKLVSLSILRPHLPSVQLLQAKYEEWEKETKNRIRKMGVVSLNASKTDDDENKRDDAGKTDANQERSELWILFRLFQTLLEIGIDWANAISILKKNGSDMAVEACILHPQLKQTLCTLMERRISDIYYTKVDNIGSELVAVKKEPKQTDCLNSLLHHDLESSQKIESKSTLEKLCLGLLDILPAVVASGCMATNPILYVKLCRLVQAFLKESSNDAGIVPVESLQPPVLHFLEQFLVPSLSHFPHNSAISSELWLVLSILPYQIRYALYASSRKQGLEKAALRSLIRPSKALSQIQSEVDTAISTKFIFKRMSKENVKDMGRQIARVAHNNPLVVFTLMLNQIESYDNLIEMMVDAFKFMGTLSLDVMGYCLLVSLGGEGEVRDKVKEDGVNAAQWLSSLETFTGAFYKRFPEVEIRGLLSYLMARVQGGFTLELGVLLSLFKVAGGYSFADTESTASLSTLQLEGRCGSLALRRETSDFGIVNQVNYRASRKLRSVLQADSLGIVLLILLSQLREKVLFDDSKGSVTQVKLIGNLYDKCHRTMNVLLGFLTDGSEDIQDKYPGAIESYAKSLPSLLELREVYGVNNADAWTLCRPLIRASLAFMSDTENADSIPKFLLPFYPFSDEAQDSYTSMIPKKSWNHITPSLFQTFLSYSVYDLIFPEERYQTEISRVKKEIDRLLMLQKGGKDAKGMQSSMAAAVAAAGGTEREIRQATAFTKAHDLELQRYRQSLEMMTFDMNRQQKHCQDVRLAMVGMKDKFFCNLAGQDGVVESANVFFTTCIYARCLLSPEDAMYCASFIMMLHEMSTPGFFTIQLFDIIVNSIVGSLYSITEDEAGCLGVFFSTIWGKIVKWRYEPDVYSNEVVGKPGAQFEIGGESEGSMKDSELSHDNYVVLYNKWQNILSTVFIGCLQSTEYIYTRTALILLNKMVDVFPTKSTIGSKLLLALDPLKSDSNPMQDIKTMASGYASQISRRNDTGTWMEEDNKTAKARVEKEKKQGEQRKKMAEMRSEEVKKDSEASIIGKPPAAQTDSSSAKVDDRKPVLRFTPPAGVNEQRRSNERNRDQDIGRRNDTREGDDSRRGIKRNLSEPDVSDRNNTRGDDRDSKRSRREPSPPRRGPNRRQTRR